MGANSGIPSSSDLQIALDGLAAIFKYSVSPHGTGQPSESSLPSIAYQAQLAITKVEGDGTSANPGLANSPLQSGLLTNLYQIYNQSRIESLASPYKSALSTINMAITQQLPSYVNNGIPSKWSMSTSGVQTLDAWLRRINGTWLSGTMNAIAPSAAPSIAATTGGSLPSVSSGNAPRIVFTWVYDTDWNESLPSAECTQVALTGSNSAYSLSSFPSPPTGATKVRLYRGLTGGSTGTYGYVTDVAISGGAVPTTIINLPDNSVRMDISPPSWMCCLMLPEFAYLYSLCGASLSGGANSLLPPASTVAYSIANNALLSERVTALGRIDGLIGYNNPPSTAQLAQWTATTNTYGAIRIAVDTAQDLQGFLGAAGGLQARVTSALSGSATITNVAITYIDAAHPNTPQTETLAGPFVLTSGVGSTISIPLTTAGQICRSITGFSVAGATIGTFVIEASPLRTI